MFRKVEDFVRVWQHNAKITQRLLDTLTDESLNQEVTPQGRTLGRIAWHMVTSIHFMMAKAGLDFPSPGEGTPVPHSAQEIARQFQQVSHTLAGEVEGKWTDESLKVIKNFFGQELPYGMALLILLQHQIHHRGQLTILMRQAELKVSGVIGPAKEEWAEIGMEAPE